MTTTADATSRAESRKRVLDPIERSSEVLFGLIMVLTFTRSIDAATAHRQELKEMLFGALGCNLAWGIVDAIMYLLSTLGERGRGINILRRVRGAKSAEEARQAVVDGLPDEVAECLGPDGIETLRSHVLARPEPPASPRLRGDDFVGAFGVFLLVFLSTLPVVIPFCAMQDAQRALRVSTIIALAMLFLAGLSLGRFAFRRPWLIGLVMTALGALLVAITMALGG